MTIENSSTNPFDQMTTAALSDGPADMGAGSGGGEMTVWSESREVRLSRLAIGTYVNNSSYTLSAGVVDTPSDGFDTGFEGGERGFDLPEPDGPSVGSGGGDMTVWSASRAVKLSTLGVGTYANNSSYTLPAGVVDTPSDGFQTGFEDGEAGLDLPEPGETLVGSGGGPMDVWTDSRAVRLKRLATGTYVNNSEFPIPAGVVDAPSDGFQTGFEDGERGLGLSVTGQAINPEGYPLRGTVIVYKDGEQFGGLAAVGTYAVSFPPDEGVTQGADAEVPDPTWDLEFVPDGDGIGVEQNDVSYPKPAFFNVTYGYLAGYVTDRDGNPVPDALVTAGTQSTTTETDGYYALLAPGGVSVELTSLEGSSVRPKTAEGGATVQTDFQFAAARVTVKGPEGTPVRNAPVTIDGENYRTNDAGVVYDPQIPVGSLDLVLLDGIEETLEVLDEGQLAKHDFKGGVRVNVTAIDGTSGRPITELPAVDPNTAVRSYSNSSGVASLVSGIVTDFDIRVGDSDKRYRTERIESNPGDGDVEDVTVHLDRRTAISNT